MLPTGSCRLVEMRGLEPLTPRVQGGRSPTELHPRARTQTGAGGPAWTRTRDLSLIRTALWPAELLALGQPPKSGGARPRARGTSPQARPGLGSSAAPP